MKSIVDELKDANERGVAPPQDWTHRAIEEIESLQNKLNKDSQLFELACKKVEIANLQCCGNCGHIITPDCPKWSTGMLTEDYETWQSCIAWSTDGLTHDERLVK